MSFSLRNLFRKEESGGFEANSLSDQRIQQQPGFAATDPIHYFQQGAGAPSLGAPSNPENPFSSPFQQGPARRGDIPRPSSHPVPFPVAPARQSASPSAVAPPPLAPQGYGGPAPAQAPSEPFGSSGPFGAAPFENHPPAAKEPIAPKGASPFGAVEPSGENPGAAATAPAPAPAPATSSPFTSVEAPPEATPFQTAPAPLAASAIEPAPGGGAWQFSQPVQEPRPTTAPAGVAQATDPSFPGTFGAGSPFGDPSGATPAISGGDPAKGQGGVPSIQWGNEAVASTPTDGGSHSRFPDAPRGGAESFSGVSHQPKASTEVHHHAGAPAEPVAAPPAETPAPSAPAIAAGVQKSFDQELPDSGGDMIDLNLNVILAGVPPQILGFNAAQVPTTITTQLPLEMIRAQLAAGVVKATVDQIMRGCDPAYQPAFTRANLAHEVSLPLQEIFHNLPADNPEANVSQGEAGAIFGGVDPGASDGAGAEPAAESEGDADEFLTASTGVPRNHELDDERVFSALFEQVVGSDPAMGGEPEPLESLEAEDFSEQGMASSDGLSSGDFPGELERPEGIPPLGSGVVHSEESEATEAGEVEAEHAGSGGQAVEKAGREAAAMAEKQRQREEPESGDDVSREFAALESSGARVAARTDYEFGIEDESGESALNSILMTDEELSIQRVAELASEFPGIGACCILSADGRLLGGNLPQNVQARLFEAMAPRLYRNFQELSSDLGLGSAEIFTVHTDKGTVSFFTSLYNCLVVLHSRRDFVPGVRGKLISIAVEMKQFHT